jgi:predicted ATPase
MLHGYALVLGGDPAAAIPAMERGFALIERTQTGTMVPVHHAVHAYALASMGRYDDAAREAAIVQAELRSGTERYYWPESLRWIGDYRRLLPGARLAEVEAAYAQALAYAREQQGKSWELGAATSLARFWAEQGARDKAIALLSPLHDAFTEGLDTPALREAADLLDLLRTGATLVASRASNPV